MGPAPPPAELGVKQRERRSEVLERAWWARWCPEAGRRFTLGLEEEVMLLDPIGLDLSYRGDSVLERLPPSLTRHMSPETHAAVVELATGVHRSVAGVGAELSALRARLARELPALGLVPACAGMHPFQGEGPSDVSSSERYQLLESSLRLLAHREPTMALHVHVGVPDPEDAVRVMNRLRENVPILLALSANSPFIHGRDGGFSSTRTVIFGGFPRTGAPRWFGSYAEYVGAIDALIASGAVPEPTFFWWDVRLQPRFGTVELRVMDAQSRVADAVALAALVQSLAALELEGEPPPCRATPELLGENCFLAARDGVDARLVDPARETLVPVRTLVRSLVAECGPHAMAVGCADELDDVLALAAVNGAVRQRQRAAVHGRLSLLAAELVDDFTARRPAAPMTAERST
jgi:glutamate---cysteine ligase / carboxylate-amine ligase